jgi:hypothetical protein
MQLSQQAIDKLKAHKFTKTAAASYYGFVLEDGTVKDGDTKACHSGMARPPAHMVATWTVLYCRNKETDIHESFVPWLTDPVVSPWRDLLDDSFFHFTNNNGDIVLVVGCVEKVSCQFITSFFKATRIYTEYPRHGQIYNKLVDNGVHPTLAFYFSQGFYEVGTQLNWYQGWHGSMLNRLTETNLANFVKGAYKDCGKPYTKDPKYYGVDGIFGDNGAFLKDNAFPNKYNCREEYVKPRWSPAFNVPSITIPKLIKICKQLEEEFGLEQFTAQRAA